VRTVALFGLRSEEGYFILSLFLMLFMFIIPCIPPENESAARNYVSSSDSHGPQ